MCVFNGSTTASAYGRRLARRALRWGRRSTRLDSSTAARDDRDVGDAILQAGHPVPEDCSVGLAQSGQFATRPRPSGRGEFYGGAGSLGVGPPLPGTRFSRPRQDRCLRRARRLDEDSDPCSCEQRIPQARGRLRPLPHEGRPRTGLHTIPALQTPRGRHDHCCSDDPAQETRPPRGDSPE